MKKAYDFSKARRGPVTPAPGKTRMTIYLDDDLIARFKALSESSGKGYQTLINEALRQAMHMEREVLTTGSLRRILQEELVRAAR